MRIAAGLLSLTCLLGSGWAAEPSRSQAVPVTGTPAEASSVTKLLEVTGVFARARPQADRVVAQLRSENPRIPTALWTRFEQQIVSRDALIALYAPIYAQHLSEEDLRAALDFYRSPAGARLLEAMPAIQAETRNAALSWVGEIASDLIGSDDEQAPSADASSTDTSMRPANPHARARMLRVHELLETSGTVTQAQQVMNEMINRLQAAPQGQGLTASMWEAARVRLTHKPDLIQLWTPAYVHNLSDHEVMALLRFYHSAAGLRFVTAQSDIQKAVVEAAVQQGRDAVKQATREVLGPLPQWTLEHSQATPGGSASAPRDAPGGSPP
jgi:hypothetical protein